MALHSTARAWRQALDRRLKDLGVGQAGWMAIATIAKADKPMSQTELAQSLNVEDPTMVSMIDRLAKAGFIVRVPSETDRRVKLIELTETGMQLYGKVKTEADAFRAEFLAQIDPQKLLAATEVLETLQASADSLAAGSPAAVSPAAVSSAAVSSAAVSSAAVSSGDPSS
ncbi:MarR family winged helix-turn-helix transcriptional regulator [Glaciimonas sp. PAMC28666]|uniref:MarR family winged helix-turn-helix transcriptional regulator n=1 Tax=Glaciimonas sp. PAMC28666 TaxID=2807626 RepID=UPI001F037358|nr:MarR family transcriptional regulator [Glaciimonas sp. PAMC28666]